MESIYAFFCKFLDGFIKKKIIIIIIIGMMITIIVIFLIQFIVCVIIIIFQVHLDRPLRHQQPAHRQPQVKQDRRRQVLNIFCITL